MSNQKPKPPDELNAGGRNLWNAVMSEYELDMHELLLLRQACRVVDILDRLSVAAESAPLAVTNSRGDVISNPILVESRMQGIVLARLFAALRLPSGDEEGRPQRRSGARGVYSPRRYGNANLRPA